MRMWSRRHQIERKTKIWAFLGNFPGGDPGTVLEPVVICDAQLWGLYRGIVMPGN